LELLIDLTSLDFSKLLGLTFKIWMLYGLPDSDKSKDATTVPFVASGTSFLFQKGSLNRISSAGACGSLQGIQANTEPDTKNNKIDSVFNFTSPLCSYNAS